MQYESLCPISNIMGSSIQLHSNCLELTLLGKHVGLQKEDSTRKYKLIMTVLCVGMMKRARGGRNDCHGLVLLVPQSTDRLKGEKSR